MTRKQCIVCHKTFYCKSTLNRHVKNIHGDRGEKDVCGEALSIDIPRQGEMRTVENTSFIEMEYKDSVLNNNILSDKQNVILNNEAFKKDLFKKK